MPTETASKNNRKVAMVTGATRGIGKTAALSLARAGFDLVVTGRTLHEGQSKGYDSANPIALPGSLDSTLKDLAAIGVRAIGVEMDILDRGSIDRAVDKALAEYGRIDVLLNNALYAGPGNSQPLLGFDMDEAERVLAGSTLNQIHITRRVLEPMLAQGGGRIIFMSSRASVSIPKGKPPKGGSGLLYAVSKAGMNRISDFVHLEHFDEGVCSFLIHPAFTLTDTMEAKYGGKPAYIAGMEVHKPEDTADVVVWLATHPDAARYSGAKLISAPHFFAEQGIDPLAA